MGLRANRGISPKKMGRIALVLALVGALLALSPAPASAAGIGGGLGNFFPAENIAPGTTITTIVGTGTGTISYSIVSGNTGSVFDIDSGGALFVDGTLDFEDEVAPNPYVLTVRVTDSVPSSVEGTVTVFVTNAYDGPTVDPLQSFDIFETAGVPSTVGTVTATAGSNGPTTGFMIASSVPAGAPFSISDTGVLTTTGPLDTEATPSYTLNITATDGIETLPPPEVGVTVNVTNVDEPPTITGGLGPASVSEGAGVGTIVTDIDAVDVDSPSIVYSITAGPGSGDFIIDASTGIIRTAAALDRETTPSYSLTVVASAGGKSDSGVVTVTVTNVNEAPMVSVPTATVVAGEDEPYIPVITFSDPDVGDTHTYTIDWGDLTTPSTGAASSPLGVAHTYAANGIFTVTVTITDGGLDDVGSFDVEVVDDPIVMVAGPARAFTEGSSVTITASFTDAPTFAHTATVDWGDGTPASPAKVVVDQKNDTVTASHTYPTRGDVDGETDFLPTIRLTRSNGSGVGTASVPVKMTNMPPVIDKLLITDANGVPKTTFSRGETTKVSVKFSDPGVTDTHEVRVSWQDATPDHYEVIAGVGAATRSFVATHAYTDIAPQTISVIIDDGEGGTVSKDAVTILIVPGGGAQLETVGVVDPTTGLWSLRNAAGVETTFYYGNPGDFPIIGDWDCDGDETPGMYRQSDGFVYLRNSNTQGVADIKFFFGDPGDVPIVGDFDGNGCHTVSIYRPSQSKVFIINKLGANNGGLGQAEVEYFFGDPGDKPFVGDFDGDGVETIGLHRESTGLVYFRNSHTQGVADNEFIFGDPGDRLIAGDWLATGIGSPAVFRPGDTTFYFRHSNTQGVADNQFVWGDPQDLPVAGNFGLG